MNFFTIPEGGIIQSSDSRINCGAGATACGIPSTPVGGISAVKGQTEYTWFQANGTTLTTVTLTATATAGNAFIAWAGDCGLANSVGNVCTLTAGADRMVAAVFGPPGSGHGDFSSGAVHGAALQAGTLDCKTCHAGGAGQATAPACSACHQGIINTAIPRVPVTEACEHCHSAGAWSASTLHALKNQVAVSNVVITGPGAGIQITYNVKVDGVNRDDFTALASNYVWVYSSTTGSAVRTSLITSLMSLVSNGNGNYTLTIPPAAWVPVTPSGTPPVIPPPAVVAFGTTSFLVNVSPAALDPKATFLAHYTTGNIMPGVLVTNSACTNCHGDFVFKATNATGIPTGHHGANPYGVEACVVCHDRDSSQENRLAAPGTRLMGYVHGIHASHMMPGATKLDGTTAVPAGIYYRNFNQNPTPPPAVPTGVGLTSQFSIGFPGFMNNCSTCHDAGEITTIASTPVSWKVCMSCHVGPPTIVTPASTTAEVAPGFAWAGFGVANTGTAAAPIFSFGSGGTFVNHAGYTATTDCSLCHVASGLAGATIADFHNGLKTARAGLIWNGADVSVVEGAKFALAVTGVSRVGANYLVTWTASYNGAAVNPCNTDFAVGPVFMGITIPTGTVDPTGKSSSNMQFIKAYAQGDDWVNANRTGVQSPGQPATSSTLAAANTTCSANVATTTTPVDPVLAAPVGTKGTMALQGKPQLRFASAAGTTGEFIQARAKSPTYNFVVPAADGAAVAGAPRRNIVDTGKCLDCHLGSLYQHGGNRVDNVDLCVTCHNPAANEANVRIGYGVTTAEAYDGKPGEAYDMRTMIHAIHSAGETSMPYVIYRTRGIYAFGSVTAIADLKATKNWPTTGGITCATLEGPVTWFPVYGSITSGTVPVVQPDGTCTQTGTPASTNGTWQIHNEIVVHYPNHLNDCGACHTGNSQTGFGNQAQRMAVTVDAGPSPWGNQADDVLRGAGAQSCTTCHQFGPTFRLLAVAAPTAAQLNAGIQAHVNSFGWAPKAITVQPDGVTPFRTRAATRSSTTRRAGTSTCP